MVLRVQVKFAHSLLRRGWLWVGTTSVYFGITYVCFIPCRLPVFAVESQYRHQDFLFLWKVSFERHIRKLKKIMLEVFFSCLCDGLLGVTYASMLVATQWPLKHTAHLTLLVWVCVVWRPEKSMELSALWNLLMTYRIGFQYDISMPLKKL